MLSLHDITLEVASASAPLLNRVSLQIPAGRLVGIVGPAGSGKSTLIKVIAGLHEPTEGSVHWCGRDLDEEDLAPYDIGYVPQFSIAFDHLTVWESLIDALRLRVKGLGEEARYFRAKSILNQVGILGISGRKVRFLSGGEKRRLGLALELATFPSLLIADEVTSGLDPKSEEEIMRLMYDLTRGSERIVLAVTHNLRHLSLCDSVVVMFQGVMTFHGSLPDMLEYFRAETPEDVFLRLAKRTPQEWETQWAAKRAEIEPREDPQESAQPAGSQAPVMALEGEVMDEETVQSWQGTRRETAQPGAFAQFAVLLARRWRIFFRDRSQVWLHVALLLGFPCLVAIFALNGMPQIQNPGMTADINVVEQLRQAIAFTIQSAKVGQLVSGLVIMQVVLLTLMGSNNSAREIAGERLIFEKEKLGGLRPLSYLASKAAFLFVLVALQSCWMAIFVNHICHLPGELSGQVTLLLLANAAMTSVCLAISSLMKSPEQASLVSIYLVGFQLPLSGAVLGLPDFFGWITRPFIAAYWSWSGILQSMRDTRYYDIVASVSPTDLLPAEICVWTLACHVVIGLIISYLGCIRSRWE
ncbi:MAG: ATP-binding cassette domain-containing protein [Chthoniobacteraceae bacterium]